MLLGISISIPPSALLLNTWERVILYTYPHPLIPPIPKTRRQLNTNILEEGGEDPREMEAGGEDELTLKATLRLIPKSE